MKTPQFTPGPHQVYHERNKFDSTFDSLTVVAQDGIVLATINVPAFAPHLAEPIANAHLFASAPSLYAALKRISEEELDRTQCALVARQALAQVEESR